jgi:hypothetical protein
VRIEHLQKTNTESVEDCSKDQTETQVDLSDVKIAYTEAREGAATESREEGVKSTPSLAETNIEG